MMSANLARRPRGSFYATAISTRDNGKRYGREVARQARTGIAAARALDETGLPGYVQVWSDRTQQRSVWATRRADGSWFCWDALSRAEVELDPATLKAVAR